MRKAKDFGVEHESRDTKTLREQSARLGRVDVVTKNRMTEVFQVNADLVGPACVKCCLDKGRICQFLEDSIISSRLANFSPGHFCDWNNRHGSFSSRMTSGRYLHSPLLRVGVTEDDRPIDFLNLVGFKGVLQFSQSVGRFSQNKNPGRIPIEPMDDARTGRIWPRLFINRRRVSPQPPRNAYVAIMDNQTGRLIDDND